MFKRKLKKQNKFKRLLLKLLNIYAINPETFELINPEQSKPSQNYYKFNDKSLILSSGFLNFSRKIKKLDIFYRFSSNVFLLNSKSSWKRIIPNIDKKTLIKVSLLSLKKSILSFLQDNDLIITLNLIFDETSKDFNDELKKILKNNKFEIKFLESKIKGN